MSGEDGGTMVVAQVSLTDEESEALQALAERTGKTRDELLREVVVQLVAQSRQQDRLALLRQAKGMWRDRDDLPDWRELRDEWDRYSR
jgi:predicted transcriptional regulator